MNDLRMGFKHTILHRLQHFELCSSKITHATSEERAVAPPTAMTDFSISRILGEPAERPLRVRKIARQSAKWPTEAPTATTTTLNTVDILDLSKSSAQQSPLSSPTNTLTPTSSAPTSPSGLHTPLPNYYALHPDFLAAATTKFYAQFFPHMFSGYTTAHLNIAATPPNATPISNTSSAYSKRYFAPYIVNTSLPTAPVACSRPLPALPSVPVQSLHSLPLVSSCPRPDCSDCMLYYKQFPEKFATNYAKSRNSSTDYQLVNSTSSSTFALATVTNLNLTSSKNCGPKTPSGNDRITTSTINASLNTEEISYKCCICDKVFGCSQTLQAHEKTHKSPRYECTDCGKGFSQLRNYKYHLSVHRGTKEFAAECPECGKTFNDKGYLSSHMKIHRNKKEYECPYCPKSFNQRVAFNMHVRIHTGVKPHKCAECGKRFSRKMLLKQHMRTHSGEKPYQCSVCGKSFADRSNMTLHHRLHSGIKPFNCPICPKAFTKKHHLKTHLNYHTGCKPYVCPHPNCNQAFTQSSNMRTHAKKCQYRPLQLSFPVASTTVATTASAALAASNSRATQPLALPLPPSSSSSSSSLSRHPLSTSDTAAIKNRHMAMAAAVTTTTATLSAGIRMLPSASHASAPMAGNNVAAFPPAQQQLLSTLRPF